MKQRLLSLVPMITACALSVGCIVERVYPDEPPVDYGHKPAPPHSTAQGTPVVVEIDPNRTMSIEGGEGVGVFVEYASGGHWRLSWTCDTAYSRRACEFVLRARAISGEILWEGERSRSFLFDSVTAYEVHSVEFTTEEGSDLEVSATVDGERSGRFFFFVQDGQVNGGYDGALTNPVVFRPRS